MIRQETENNMQANIQLLINDAIRYQLNTGKKPGYKKQRFFMLSIALLYCAVTYRTLSYYYERFMSGEEPATGYTGAFSSYFNHAKNRDGKLLFGKLPEHVKGKFVAVYITPEGLEEWLRLRHLLDLPEGYIREGLSEEEVRKYYSEAIEPHQKNSITDHSNDVFDCYSEIINLLCKNGKRFGTVYHEALRGSYFQPSFSLRSAKSRGCIVPDVSYSYAEDRYRNNPVVLEVDLDSESVSTTLADKFRSYMSYSEKVSAEDGCSPLCSILYCRNSAQQEASVKIDPGKELPFDDREIWLIRSYSWVRVIQLISALYVKDPSYMTKAVDEFIYPLLCDIRDEEIAQILGQETCELIEMVFCISSKYFREYGRKLTIAQAYALREGMREHSYELYRARRASDLSDKSQRRSKILFDTFRSETSGYARDSFLSGFCLSCVPDGKLGDALPSLLPCQFGTGSVRAVLKMAGLTPGFTYFCPCFPILKYGKEYLLWMRNAFKSDGVMVFFEDLGYDIGALWRIRQYMLLPSDLGARMLLVVIVNDDLSTASGRPLNELKDDISFCEKEYADAFITACNSKEKAAFSYHSRSDICFLKRSEFLSKDPEKMHPFIIFGRKFYAKRTAPAMTTFAMQEFSYREKLSVGGTRSLTQEFVTYKK